jgi:hypothetical protein
MKCVRQVPRREAKPDNASRWNLTALTYIDPAGIELLQEVLHGGARIEGCSRFVAELLNLTL